MIYTTASTNEISYLIKLVSDIWNDTDLSTYINSNNAQVFVCKDNEKIVGVAIINLRHEYVEGCSNYPVAYLEGIYVLEEYRNQDIAKTLLAECEKWAISKNVKQLASDCELDNLESYGFHIACGFNQVKQITCFKKEL